MSDAFDDLKKLAEMRETGQITDAEYHIVKGELLAEVSAGSGSEGRPPGWYNDPEGKYSHQAYWDGTGWTGETRPDLLRSKKATAMAGEAVSSIEVASLKPPFWRRSWFIIVATLLTVGIVGSLFSLGSDPTVDDSKLEDLREVIDGTQRVVAAFEQFFGPVDDVTEAELVRLSLNVCNGASGSGVAVAMDVLLQGGDRQGDRQMAGNLGKWSIEYVCPEYLDEFDSWYAAQGFD